MVTLRTEIEIVAPPSTVWHTLYHQEEWERWNTFLFATAIEPGFQVNQLVRLVVCRSAGEGKVEFQSRVEQVQPQVCLAWVSQTRGFRSESRFELEAVNPQRTRYLHTEAFSGWLAGLLLPFMGQAEQEGMERMAAELKRYLESDSKVLDGKFKV
ncbi:MAG: SRPBCC domain-containing protein [Oscillatoriales cyanobacterium RM2_1_1]|nr:SRPBCC domain-containing protein [Oscillatoriales cyanobacterium SM2_3_0]NJO47418.1 SRPBCC domain-containing protein [Oscillatoriales cyanobacterium RM2_1_1]